MYRYRPRLILLSGVLLVLATLAAATTAVRTRSGAAFWVAAPPPPVVVARYTFDGAGPAAWADVSGNGHRLRPVTGHGAAAGLIGHAAGRAVRFPAPCRQAPCPRLVLRAAPSDKLNPAARPFRFGAALRLAPNRTSAGQNVVQKGYSNEGSQYKLQVDGRSGHPSCALVQGTAIHLVLARVSVSDNRWHSVECRRSGTNLAVYVDGFVQGFRTVPAGLSVVNQEPLSLGGKSAFGDNDQFHGVLDDVWVAVG
ncbi:LamG-like jellyroll fold domain-containing protein [Actinoplanes sp. DH11]|uniref:LamG-like jellyroll fold domain-containing protein n=1 Tax=Actinoplanes sp. DH11 TaxID=2857011 RepID=UPI001E49FF9B|nr:LamG-like jellyroll fold domain-containing protein [Actinoplanes sp. DH11]